jgi:hypothetical protein
MRCVLCLGIFLATVGAAVAAPGDPPPDRFPRPVVSDLRDRIRASDHPITQKLRGRAEELRGRLPGLAQIGKGNANGYAGQGKGNHYGHAQGVPAPLLGAGLPAFALGGVAFAGYRLWRRSRARSTES